MQWNQKLWQRSIDQFAEFLESVAAGLGRRERREGAALYVQGLLMPGERKSIGSSAEVPGEVPGSSGDRFSCQAVR